MALETTESSNGQFVRFRLGDGNRSPKAGESLTDLISGIAGENGSNYPKPVLLTDLKGVKK